MKESLDEDILNELKKKMSFLVVLCGYFSTKKKLKKIYQDVILHTIDDHDVVRHYGRDDDAFAKSFLEANSIRKNRQCLLNPSALKTEEGFRYLALTAGERGTLVWSKNIDDEALKTIIGTPKLAGVVVNMGVYCSKSAINFVKTRVVDQKSDKVYFICGGCNGIRNIYIGCKWSRLVPLYKHFINVMPDDY